VRLPFFSLFLPREASSSSTLRFYATNGEPAQAVLSNTLQAYEKFGESASLLARPSALSGVRWVAGSAGNGLARSRVCNWHQKSRAWRRPVATRVSVTMVPLGEPLRSLCPTLECNTQRVVLSLLGTRPHNSIPIILLRTRLHQLFFSQVRSGFYSERARILLIIYSPPAFDGQPIHLPALDSVNSTNQPTIPLYIQPSPSRSPSVFREQPGGSEPTALLFFLACPVASIPFRSLRFRHGAVQFLHVACLLLNFLFAIYTYISFSPVLALLATFGGLLELVLSPGQTHRSMGASSSPVTIWPLPAQPPVACKPVAH
jgi:hypothetical protein